MWHLFRERITWSVDNGETVSSIQDDWTPSLGPLQIYLILGKFIPILARVLNFVIAFGGLNWAVLIEYFTKMF